MTVFQNSKTGLSTFIYYAVVTAGLEEIQKTSI